MSFPSEVKSIYPVKGNFNETMVESYFEAKEQIHTKTQIRGLYS